MVKARVLNNAYLVPEIVPQAKGGSSRNVSGMDMVEKQTCFLYLSFPISWLGIDSRETLGAMHREDSKASVSLDP